MGRPGQQKVSLIGPLVPSEIHRIWKNNPHITDLFLNDKKTKSIFRVLFSRSVIEVCNTVDDRILQKIVKCVSLI
jgi:hypothetical protein